MRVDELFRAWAERSPDYRTAGTERVGLKPGGSVPVSNSDDLADRLSRYMSRTTIGREALVTLQVHYSMPAANIEDRAAEITQRLKTRRVSRSTYYPLLHASRLLAADALARLTANNNVQAT